MRLNFLFNFKTTYFVCGLRELALSEYKLLVNCFLRATSNEYRPGFAFGYAVARQTIIPFEGQINATSFGRGFYTFFFCLCAFYPYHHCLPYSKKK